MTYQPLQTGATPTLGTSGAAVSALQTQLNTQNAGQTGYTPLLVDGKYGPLTAAGAAYKVPASTNPAITGAPTSATNTAITNDVSALTNTSTSSQKFLQDRMDNLEQQRKDTLIQIQKDYGAAQGAQETRQGQDYAGRATGLVTSGGGFLGATQSHEGVLQNLKATFEGEKNALMAKRDAAIQEANNAINDKQFALARDKATEAKSYEQEVYNRQKDLADQQLAIAREARSKQEFDMGVTEKKAAAYASMSDAEFAKQNPTDIAELDKSFFSGYTTTTRTLAKKALDVKTKSDAIKLDSDILDMRLKMPQGKKFTLAGQTYTGLKKPDAGSGTASEKQDAIFSKMSELLSGAKNTDGLPLYTIPGSDGIPYIDSNNFLTPEGWKYLSSSSGFDANEIVKRNSHLFSPSALQNYQLSEVQKNLIRPKI